MLGLSAGGLFDRSTIMDSIGQAGPQYALATREIEIAGVDADLPATDLSATDVPAADRAAETT